MNKKTTVICKECDTKFPAPYITQVTRYKKGLNVFCCVKCRTVHGDKERLLRLEEQNKGKLDAKKLADKGLIANKWGWV